MKVTVCFLGFLSLSLGTRGALFPRIIGGKDAAEGQFPYQVSLQALDSHDKYQHVCGGSIISPTHILTAGHCVVGKNSDIFRVVGGILKLSGDEAHKQVLEVQKIVIHPDYHYDQKSGVDLIDIALIQLKSSIQFNELVQPISLPQPGYVASGDAVLSGWGLVDDWVPFPLLPNTLQEATIPILDNSGAPNALGPRIIGGEDATEGQFPYQVSLQLGTFGLLYQHMCGGSIISPLHILTAGHCIISIPFTSFRVKAGILNLEHNGRHSQVLRVRRTLVHPGYEPDINGGVGPNDIALIQLRSKLHFNEYVRPIALPQPGYEASGYAMLSGWGSIGGSTLFPTMPNTLQLANLPVLNNTECKRVLDETLGEGSSDPFDFDSNICTGPLTGGHSACSGDSGGPLAQNNTVVGVVSWGTVPCGQENAPSVFTKVANFVDWIRENVEDLEDL